MKKLSTIFSVIICLAVVGITSNKSMAQGRFSIGANLGLPMGSFGDAYSLGIGGSVGYEANISDKLNWTGQVGYLSYSGKDIGGYTVPSASMVPILGGVKYYLNESFNAFYVGAQAGFTITSVSIGGGFGTVSSTNFTFAPGVGYHLANIDIGASYQIVSDANYLGVRVAYVLGGK